MSHLVPRVEDLDGWPTSRGELRVAERRPGRFPEEQVAVVVVAGGATAMRLRLFSGRPSAGIPPWIEAGVSDDDALVPELILALAGLLPPGGRLMIAYGDDETERELTRKVPPVATPIGYGLFTGGCTWLKDWYFAEGWLEGDLKLQGNKPQSDAERYRQLAALRAEVAEWLTADASLEPGLRRARERAHAVLDRIDVDLA